MTSAAPYLFFDGNCREAMTFYQACFGGDLQIMTWADAPDDCGMPIPEDTNLVMHAGLTKGELSILACDNPEGPPNAGDNVSICINTESVEETDSLFAALSADGQPFMPPNHTFWGAYFGMFVDKFGFRWMLHCQLEH